MSFTTGDGAGGESEWHSEQALFEHSPLTVQTHEMRLLKMLPELSKDGLVCCEMEHAQIEDAFDIAFDAVSYMWGSDLPRNPILVNGCSFTVRENLWDFLNTARETRPYQWLWIDALSIAQSDGEEKEHQIRLMRDIFKSAEQTLIWLGPGNEAIESLMRLTEANELCTRINQIRARRESSRPRTLANIGSTQPPFDNTYYPPETWRSYNQNMKMEIDIIEGISAGETNCEPYQLCDEDRKRARDDLYYGDDVLLQGTYALVQHPYWSRAWIIQEVLLASKRTLLYGKWTLPWEQYCDMMQLFLPKIVISRNMALSLFCRNKLPLSALSWDPWILQRSSSPRQL